jgi:hypothetical protein
MDEYILPSVFGILVAVALWMASRLVRREVNIRRSLKINGPLKRVVINLDDPNNPKAIFNDSGRIRTDE